MRLFAIGDIHGCFTALQSLLDSAPITDNDLIVTLGDYVNRGPNAKAVIDWAIAREATGKLIPLRGNHEVMLLAARDSKRDFRTLLDVGGKATLASYGPSGEPGKLSDIPPEHWAFIERTRPYHETESHIFVHANLYDDVPLDEQPDSALYWEKFDPQGMPLPHQSGKTIICGHTAQKSGRPLSVGHAVCIDTWVYGGGWLTCLEVATGQYWQANQQSETRNDWIEE